MSGTLGILAFIVTLMVMILFHEFGHFITAKRFGMKVEEFSFGFGPSLWARTRGETTYLFKPILLGGYVKIAGMNPWQPVPESELHRTFGAKSGWQRAVVLSAGSFTHFVLATLVLFALFAFIGIPGAPTTTLSQVNATITPPPGFTVSGGEDLPGPAKVAGLLPGDRIVAIDTRRVAGWDDLRNTIRNRPGQPVVVEATRDSRSIEVKVTPIAATGDDEQGNPVTIGLIGISPETSVEREPVHVAAWTATRTTGILIATSVRVIGRVFSPAGIARVFSSLGEGGAREGEEPIGLVGGARIAGQAASAGQIAYVLEMLTFFVVIIGVFNLLPLPPLDGGYLLIVLIEKIRGRKVDLKRVVPVMAVVIVFLVFLQIALLYLDIARPLTNPFQ